MQSVNTAPSRFLRTCCLFVSVFSFVVGLSAAEPTKSYSIPAGPAETTLKSFADQSGRSVIFSGDKVRGIQTNEVKGEMTAEDALDRLLSGTKLSAVPEKSTGGFAVRREVSVEIAEKNASSRPETDRAASQWETGPNGEKVLKLDTFEVFGRKTLNMDIQRTRDDAQPYVIFDRRTISQSGAINMEDFLQRRLTMNTASGGFSKSLNAFQGPVSTFNLRGLGTNQTLILIDGHRAVSTGQQGFGLQQSDLNGIPLSAVERVEVLPTTASGIYGGGATGGVINVILRRDYSGGEIGLMYDNSFDTDSAIKRLDLSYGFTLEEGKTSVLLTGSFSEANRLQMRDRNFLADGRARILSNNPSRFLPPNSPPLGATPNISSTTGIPLTLKAGNVPLNSSFTFVPAGYSGIGTDNGLALVANGGRFNTDLANSAQFGIVNGGLVGLGNTPTNKAFTASVRRKFSPSVEGFIDSAVNKTEGHQFAASGSLANSYTLAAGAASNPFNEAIRVTVPINATDSDLVVTTRNVRLVGGLIFKLPGNWQAGADYTWHRSNYNYATQPALSDAATTALTTSLDILRDTNAYPLDLSAYYRTSDRATPTISVLRDGIVRAAGPIWHLPAGPLVLSTAIEARHETQQESTRVVSPVSTLYYPELSQRNSSVYLETLVPLLAGRSPGQSLNLQLAARFDDYAINGVTGFVFNPTPASVVTRTTRKFTSTNPTLGLRWELSGDMMLRASYGTGFLPPSIVDLAPSFPAGIGIVDPLRGNTVTTLGAGSFVQGGNPNLRPEKSESFSAGAVLTPSAIPGLRVAIDYTHIRKSDNITLLGTSVILLNTNLFPGRVTRGTNLPGDLPGWAAPVTFLDATRVNIASAEIEAYDLTVDYTRNSGALGKLTFYGAATWQPHYVTRLFPGQPLVENVGSSGSLLLGAPLKFKGNAGVTLERDAWTAGWSVRYYDSHFVSGTDTIQITTQGNGGRIPSQIYHDVFVSYRPLGAAGAGLLGRVVTGTEFTVGIRNVLNAKPPFNASNSGGGYISGLGDPRLSTYYIAVKHGF